MNIKLLKSSSARTPDTMDVPGHALAETLGRLKAEGRSVEGMEIGETNGIWRLTLGPKPESKASCNS
jgi:hypothetical protein